MKTKNNQSLFFWMAYIVIMLLILALFATLSGCSSKKTIPADWRYHKTVASVHPKLKAHKLVLCNRE